MRRKVFGAAVVLAGLAALPAAAQRAPFVPPLPADTPPPEPAPTRVAPPPKPKPVVAAPAAPASAPAPTASPTAEPPPPYEPELIRLGEVMGALSYLRDLCRAGDGATFRDKFQNLMEIEAHSNERKQELAGAFNRGFGDYQLTYRECTRSARETIVRYLDETQKIAREVATRYGG
jgi:uncharacterized protein (TIGR02301 family)